MLKNQKVIREKLEPLVDEKNGKDLDWKGYKEKSLEVVEIYRHIGFNLGAVEEQEYFLAHSAGASFRFFFHLP